MCLGAGEGVAYLWANFAENTQSEPSGLSTSVSSHRWKQDGSILSSYTGRGTNCTLIGMLGNKKAF